MKKWTAVFLSLLLALECAAVCGCSSGGQVRVLDSGGQEIAALESLSEERTELDGHACRAYLDIALSEAEECIASLYGWDTQRARRYLLEEKCVLYTAFDSEASRALQDGYAQEGDPSVPFGGAVADLEGRLLAAFSGGGEEGENYAAAKTPPYSSFKPLSVYAPAMEQGLIHWSTLYEDSPVKTITDSDGRPSDWPSNATGTYTHEMTALPAAIRESLNTTAVRCMQEVGVSESLRFLQECFGLSLDFEQNRLALYGEDEVIGNVALGYLYEGISPVEMAGYYQIFANGGVYHPPHALLKICDSQGKAVYERQEEGKQVIRPATADILNRLLQGVVSPGGTGQEAACNGVTVGGKTGSGDDGYWFAGFTPQYVCTVWHAAGAENATSRLFSAVVSGLENDPDARFPQCPDVRQAAYCCESGLLISPACRRVDLGYYAAGSEPAVCTLCNAH